MADKDVECAKNHWKFKNSGKFKSPFVNELGEFFTWSCLSKKEVRKGISIRELYVSEVTTSNKDWVHS
jgi:hypothetical protein